MRIPAPPATSPALSFCLACLGALGVGAFDVVTGADIHVFSLYFLPLAFAGMRLPRAGAALVALLTTCVWMAALYRTGAHHDLLHVWVLNFIFQGAAFLVVTMLFARLNRRLQDEQLIGRTDALTELNNRLGFFEQAERMLQPCRRHRRPVALACIDLDNFKAANDTYGHAYGDRLLQCCGAIIGASVRASDVTARMGGDEFVVLLPETDHARAYEVCCRIRRMLEAADEFRQAGVTASIGVVVDEAAQLDLAELLARGDAEMYRGKQAGRNVVSAGPELRDTGGFANPRTSSNEAP